MPLTVKQLNDGQGVVYTASGKLTGTEVVAALAEVEAPDHAPTTIVYAFFDFDDVTGVEVSTPQLRQMAEIAIHASRRGAVGRVVAIYAKDDLPFALARMWMVFVEQAGWETAVFRTRSEALAWVRKRVAEKRGVNVQLE
ncbi:MAG: hypothetical protein WAN51_03260 [Alphaproteobacteria bacterium]